MTVKKYETTAFLKAAHVCALILFFPFEYLIKFLVCGKCSVVQIQD